MHDLQVSSYTATSITLSWAELLFDSETGASPITSYSLEWDQGNGNFASLLGDPTNSLARTYQVTGLTTAKSYQFRGRARNKHDWGPYSNTLSMVPAGKPATPDPITTVIDNVYVRFSWDEPAINGAAITAYNLYILKADGFTLAETVSCDSTTDPLITQNRECLVPMNELTDVSSYGLP